MNHYLSQIAFRPQQREDHKLAHQLLSMPYLQHQKIWELFQRPPGSEQPFLYRQSEAEDLPRFLVLSDEPPKTQDARWQIQTKSFSPTLQVGQVLSFSARLNPTRSVRRPGEKRGKRQDLVMAALHEVAADRRPVERQRLVNSELPLWLSARGEQGGFAIVQDDDRLVCAVTRYEVLRFRTTASHQSHSVTLGCADFVGQLRVTDPGRFAKTLYQGIGHGRSFGLGLMLVKRPH